MFPGNGFNSGHSSASLLTPSPAGWRELGRYSVNMTTKAPEIGALHQYAQTENYAFFGADCNDFGQISVLYENHPAE
jgi:hypothetical protein